MKNKIMNQIELLLEMSGTSNTYETIKEELSSLDMEIDGLKETLKRLKKENSLNDYFLQNERVIDENIKLGVENRIRSLKEELNALEEQIVKYTEKESSMHQEIENLKLEKSHLEEFIFSIETKAKTISKSDSTYSFYDEMLTKAYTDKEELLSKITHGEELYHDLLKEIESLGTKKASLLSKLEENNKELEKVSNSLLNKLSYEDTTRKKQDEKLIDEYASNLEALETHKLNLLQDPAYLAHEASNYIIDGEEEKALEIVKELVKTINNMPYMTMSLNNVDELLKTKEKERDEFATTIDKKNYETKAPVAIQLCLSLLKSEITDTTNKINEAKKEIKNIDEKKIPNLVTMLETIKNAKKTLEEEIATYQICLTKNQEYKTPKKQAMLKSALVKKGQDLDQTKEIYNKFMRELEDLVIASKNIEAETLTALNNKMSSLTKEKELLEKNLLLRDNTVDILEMQKDKDLLKALNDETEALKERKKYSKTASEIYDEIEMNLGASKTILESPSSNSLDKYRIDGFTDSETSAEPSTPERFPDTVELATPDIALESSEEQTKIFPPREPKNTTEPEILKVIDIEPLEKKTSFKAAPPKKEEPKSDFENLDDFMINDFSSGDYISFNDLLSDGEKDEM